MGSPAEKFEAGEGPGRFSFRNLSSGICRTVGPEEKTELEWVTEAMVIPSKTAKSHDL